jgi:hypothetical protein
MGRKFTKTNTEQVNAEIIEFIRGNQDCTLQDIATGIDLELQNVNRILNGRPDRPEPVGLVPGIIEAIAGINNKGRLVWKYRVIIQNRCEV